MSKLPPVSLLRQFEWRVARPPDCAPAPRRTPGGMSKLPPISLLRQFDTHRLVPGAASVARQDPQRSEGQHSDTLRNAEIASIVQVLGAGTGRTFDISQMRYGRVILMADADVDGSHIRTLLITLFAKYMRPVIEDGPPVRRRCPRCTRS